MVLLVKLRIFDKRIFLISKEQTYGTTPTLSRLDKHTFKVCNELSNKNSKTIQMNLPQFL